MTSTLPLKHLFSLVMLLVLAGIHSCKKDLPNSKPEKEQSLIEESKAYFESTVLKAKDNQVSSSKAEKNLRQLAGKQPLWKEAFVKKISIGEAVIVPLHFATTLFIKAGKNKQALALDNLSYLMLYKNKQGEMKTEVVTRFPDDDYWDEPNRAKKPFRGMILVEDWQGNVLKGYLYTKDGKTGILKSSGGSEKGVKVQGKLIEVCLTTVTWSSVEAGNSGDPEYTYYSSTSCFTYDNGGGGGGYEPSPEDYSSNDGGGGGDGSGGTPNPCAGTINGQEPLDDGSGVPCDPAITIESSFSPNNLYNGNGEKPIGESPNKCQGAQDMWNASVSNNKEVVGLLTSDGKTITVAMLGYSGGSWGGLYKHEGTVYYTYPSSKGAPSQLYAGMQVAAGQYFIPIVATIHTHNPCIQMGGDGITNITLSEGDQSLAQSFQTINHYIIGCGAIGEFDYHNDFPSILQSGNLSTTCSKLK